MDASYDAQHNEFARTCSPKSETPFGLTLGQLQNLRDSTRRAAFAVCGTRTPIRSSSARTRSPIGRRRGATLFPQQITREFTFLPYAQIAEFTLDHACTSPKPSTFRTGRARSHGRLRRRRDAAQSRAARSRSRVFPWALLVGQRFYGEPEKAVRAQRRGPFIELRRRETGCVRWWGGSREPAAVVALREQVVLGAIERRRCARDPAPRRGDAEAGRIRQPPHLRRASSTSSTSHRARAKAAAGGRIPQGRRRASKPVLEQLLARRDGAARNAALLRRRLADARLMTPSPVINRGVVWAKVNMLRVIKEYPQGWGSTNSPPSDILVSRDTSWFVHGYDYFLPQFSRDAIEAVQPLHRSPAVRWSSTCAASAASRPTTTSTSTTTRRCT